jgi:hypothetical protein
MLNLLLLSYTHRPGMRNSIVSLLPSCQNTGHELVIYHILEHKLNHGKFKKLEIMSCIVSDNDGIKLEINNDRS